MHLARFGARTPHRPIHSLSLKTHFWAIFECFCDALCGPPHVFESLVLHSITPKTHDFTKLKGFTHVCYSGTSPAPTCSDARHRRYPLVYPLARGVTAKGANSARVHTQTRAKANYASVSVFFTLLKSIYSLPGKAHFFHPSPKKLLSQQPSSRCHGRGACERCRQSRRLLGWCGCRVCVVDLHSVTRFRPPM